MISIDDKTFKTVAQKFADELRAKYFPDVKIQHSFKLEALSHAFGYRDYNTVKPHLQQTDISTAFPLLSQNSNLFNPIKKIEWAPFENPTNPHTLTVGSGGSQTFRGEADDECFYLFSIDTTVPCSKIINDVLSLFQMSKESREYEVENNLFFTCKKELLLYSKLLGFFIMANFTKKFLQINVHFLAEYFDFEVIEFLSKTYRKHGVEKLILAIDSSSIDDTFKEKCKQNGVQLILSYTKTIDTLTDYQRLIHPKSLTEADASRYKEIFEKVRHISTEYGLDVKMAEKEPSMFELIHDLQEKEKTIKNLKQVVARLHRVVKLSSEQNQFKLNTIVAKEKIQAMLDDIGEHMSAADINALTKAMKILEKNQSLDHSIHEYMVNTQTEMIAGGDLE